MNVFYFLSECKRVSYGSWYEGCQRSGDGQSSMAASVWRMRREVVMASGGGVCAVGEADEDLGGGAVAVYGGDGAGPVVMKS